MSYILPTKELRTSLGSAIFSRRDANALTIGVIGGSRRLCQACPVVWTETVCTEATPQHRGTWTMVWQT
jgi:hypothetical protein